MITQELGVADDGSRVVDLMVIECVDSFFPHHVKHTVVLEGCEHAPISVRADGNAVFFFQENLPGIRIDSGHRTLFEEVEFAIRQAKILMLLKIFHGFIMSGIAGHDEIADRLSCLSCAGTQLFHQNLKQGSLFDRPDGKHAFRMAEAQSGTLTACNQDRPDFACCQQFLATFRCLFRFRGRRTAIFQSDYSRRTRGAFRFLCRRFSLLSCLFRGIQPLDLLEINCLDLC